MPEDELPFELHEHDQRLRVGDHYFYVRAVRRGEMFVPGRVHLESALLLAPLQLVFGRLFARCQARQPWKVGVIRIDGDRWGPTGTARVVHKESGSTLDVPTARLAQLADRVRAGDFAT